MYANIPVAEWRRTDTGIMRYWRSRVAAHRSSPVLLKHNEARPLISAERDWWDCLVIARSTTR